MTKQMLDQPESPTRLTLGRLIAVVRNAKPSQQSLALQRRRRARASDGRINAYRVQRLHA
ncbi:hypothetical protein CLV80_105157 [Yoonia maritima]|uniref:Uncharacterized protein n=1 Tax=Yoonia maritima TaxID=1435347 RepID=A0A2T0VZ76_9RHOB|nr:hypothetical protein CLV80_105157 [Yoonia maritima]